MRRYLLVFGVLVLALLLTSTPSLAAKYLCPGSIWVAGNIPNSSNGQRTLHLDGSASGTVSVGTCNHIPGSIGPSRVTLYETVPGGNLKIGVSKSSTADCDAVGANFDGKVSKSITATKAFHAMLSFDDSGILDEHMHACVQGPVTFYEH
jgi:hypothetical protein